MSKRALVFVIKRALAATALVAVLASGVTTVATSGDQTGKALSGQCAGCHGREGIAPGDQYPNLAGQKYNYLVKTLKQYKSRSRHSSVMNGIAARLTKRQIKALAKYYSSNDDAYSR